MSDSVTVPITSALDGSPVAGSPAATPPAVPPTPRRRTRKRFWLFLMVTAAVSLALYPPPWHAAVRALLTWQAARQGCDLSIDAIEGSPLDTIDLYGLRCRQRGLPVTPSSADTDPGTDLRIAHAAMTFAWALPGLGRPAPSWMRQLTIEGVRGRWDLSPGKHHAGLPLAARFVRLDALAARFAPADFLFRADDATLRRGRYSLRVRGMFLSGSRDGEGRFDARAVEAVGPRFDATLPDQHGRTFWQGDRLTLSDLDLGHGVHLARATLDGARLAHQRLDWDCDLRALGGSVRSQGAVNFLRERLALEVGGSVQQVALGPLARLLEVTGPADGQVEQASFSFRGDPEHWQAADMWVAGRATDFRWGARRWESLEVQAVVTDRRVQVHRLELRQSRNRLSLDGECSLPPDPSAAVAAGAGRWWQAGFACNVDARLEDLHDLAQLFGPPAPDIAGRMSINGRLGARPGTQGFDGYLNVEGSQLMVRGAPLDFLRSTLLFRGEELDLADLQATRGGDYLTGHGSMRIAGSPDFQALGRVSIEDLGVYAPAYAGLLPWAEDAGAAPIRSLTAGVRLEGSTLHLDQCQGEQAGNTFQVGGSVDLSDTGRPVLDLHLTGEQSARAAEAVPEGYAYRMGYPSYRAGVSYTLDLRGPLAGGATVQGDVQFLHGHLDERFGVYPAAPSPPVAPDQLLRPLLRLLPKAWQDWPLDLHVTAVAPLPGSEGQIIPDLQITGTGEHPQLGGKLEFRSTTWLGQESGAWYFSPGEPENPTVSIMATADDGRRVTYFYGPLDEGGATSWESGAPDDKFILRSAEAPLQWVADAGPWAAWLPTLIPVPERVLGPLLDGPRPTNASFSGF